MKKQCSLLFLCIFSLTSLYAQDIDYDFGEISKSLLEESFYKNDSSASAYYLFDRGEISFVWNSSSGGFDFVKKRHFRIKILKDNAKNYANFEIPLQIVENREQKISKMKAYTYNLENRKVKKTKLEKDDIFKEEVDDFKKLVKFAMPNVKKGSVIELEYTIHSSFAPYWFYLDFQKQIPVEELHYTVGVPEFYHFNQTLKGYYNVQTSQKTESKFMQVRYEDNQNRRIRYRNLSYRSYEYTYSTKQLPGFNIESDLTTIYNYLSGIEYELSFIKYPKSARTEQISTTWEKIIKELLIDSDFGYQIGKDRHLKEIANKLSTKRFENQIDLLLAAKQKIAQNIKWNKEFSYYTESSARGAFKDGIGNSAEVNFNLINLLQKLGFKAQPVVLSTRSHGFLKTVHPSYRRLNYILAKVDLEGKSYLIDGTDPWSNLECLPTHCLNDEGLIIQKDKTEWVNLKENSKYQIQNRFQINLNEDLILEGKVDQILSKHAAYQFRKNYENDQKAIQEVEQQHPVLSIKSFKTQNLDDVSANVELSYDFKLKNSVIESGNLLFLYPLIHLGITDNPYKSVKRDYPIDLAFTKTLNSSGIITIPENYSVETLPESSIVTLPNNAARLMYSAKQNGNNIQVSFLLMLNKHLYLPESYEYLKQIYGIAIEKCQESIVLVKK